jgi:ABC-type multidrug transport system fused ATPase/permease subunit
MLFGKEDATEEEINTALKKAEAYEFVNNLTDKL